MKRLFSYKGEILFGILLAAAAGLYLSVLRLGMADIDECFYLTVPYRLAQGDALLADEWHVTQLSGFLTLPFVRLWLAVSGGTEGIVLAFRALYLILQAMLCLAAFVLLRPYGKAAGAAAALLFMLFTPFGIKAPSYNTLGLMSVWLFALLGLPRAGFSRLRAVCRGIALAAAVLCNPYLILLYPALGISALVRARTAGSGGRKSAELSGGRSPLCLFGFLTLGAGLVLAAFLGFVFSRASLGEVMAGLPYILSDPAHRRKGLAGIFSPLIYHLKDGGMWLAVWAAATAAGVWMTAAAGRTACGPENGKTGRGETRREAWKRRAVSAAFVTAALSVTGLSLDYALRRTGGIGFNAVMIPPAFLGLTAFLMTQKRDAALFGGWLTGIFYALCMSATSNNGIYAAAQACAVSSCFAVPMTAAFVRERTGGGEFRRSALAWCAALTVAAQAFAEGWVMTHHFFWEGGAETLTARIESGPMAGICTAQWKKDRCEKEAANVLSLREYGGDSVMFYCRFPAGYLLLEEKRNGACSAWLADFVENPGDTRMEEWNRMHPERVPDLIYVDAQSTGVWTRAEWTEYCREKGYRLIRFETGGYGLVRENGK